MYCMGAKYLPGIRKFSISGASRIALRPPSQSLYCGKRRIRCMAAPISIFKKGNYSCRVGPCWPDGWGRDEKAAHRQRGRKKARYQHRRSRAVVPGQLVDWLIAACTRQGQQGERRLLHRPPPRVRQQRFTQWLPEPHQSLAKIIKQRLKGQCHEMVVEVRPWSCRWGLN
jgi:hypothetical protein